MSLRHSLANCLKRTTTPPGGAVDVLVVTKEGKLPEGLEHLPWDATVMIDRQPGWSKAANNLLDAAARTGHDAIFLDDDVTILPETFDGFDRYYPLADVFGFRLRGQPDQKDQAGWGLRHENPNPDRACYIAHVTASLIYIRASVLQSGVRFPDWPGLHFQDIKYTYDCWFAGFAVAYLPLPALHNIAPLPDGGMAGSTIRHEPYFGERRTINHQILDQWVEEQDVQQAAYDGRIPYGVWGIDA